MMHFLVCEPMILESLGFTESWEWDGYDKKFTSNK